MSTPAKTNTAIKGNRKAVVLMTLGDHKAEGDHTQDSVILPLYLHVVNNRVRAVIISTDKGASLVDMHLHTFMNHRINVVKGSV